MVRGNGYVERSGRIDYEKQNDVLDARQESAAHLPTRSGEMALFSSPI
jgi:hypothetical protein